MCLKEVAEEAPDDPSDEDFVGVEVVVTEGLCKDLIKSSNRSSASSEKIYQDLTIFSNIKN